jgi:epoxyqueuosine reductase
MTDTREVTIQQDQGQQTDGMTSEETKTRIRELAAAAGVHGVGFTSAAPLDKARGHFARAIESGYIPAGSVPGGKRLNRLLSPESRLADAKSVITACLSYHTGEGTTDDPRLGAIAPYTRANFYDDLESRLKDVARSIHAELGAVCRTSSNYVSLAEKPLAARSGLGFYGKNGIIITPTHGSYVVIGEIVTDLALKPDLPLEMDCGACDACVKACPTGAIKEPGYVDRRICIQYISERRGTVPHSIREVWQNRLYGCSTCQDVCPFNRDIPASAHPTSRGNIGSYLALSAVIKLNEKSFEARFSGNQVGMRERNAIRRNAIIAAGNSKAEEMVDLLVHYLNDLDPMIRRHAVWAYAKLAGAGARQTLERTLAREWEPGVKEEAKRVLDGL